jgi:PilZ domain
VKSSILTESELHRRIAQLDIERRREPRFVAEGEVVLSVMRPNGFVEIRGKIVDTSLHGLRTRHEHTGLDRGQLLLVTYPWGTVIAEVEWSTPCKEFTETGFRLL